MAPRPSSPRSITERDTEKDAPVSPAFTLHPSYVPPPHIDMKKLMRKIDLRVLPMLCVLYLLAFLDRVNISNAALFGLQSDLHLTGLQYNTCLVIFFVPYIVFEIPSNMLLKKLRPHVWLSMCMFGFGLTSTMQGLTKSYGGLLAARFFLGLFEAGMFPGCFYLLAMWYRREESQKRYTFFFCSTTLAGAFGGLLASAIGKMDGIRGFKGWRWVFILEGIVTCLFGIAWYFVIPDFPEECSFLTEEERQVVKDRLRDDVGGSALARKHGWRDTLDVFRDYKISLGGFMYFGLIVAAYGYAYFAPTIIRNLGYTAIQAQLYSVPPWACAFVFSLIVAYFSDRLRHRWLFSVGPALMSAAGFIILLSVHRNVHAEYAALFLVTMGTYTSMPLLVGWFNTNLAGHLRRSVGSAWQVGFGNIGGIIASYSFPSKDSPRYKSGYAICLAFVCLSILSSTAYVTALTLENRRRDRIMMIEGDAGDGEVINEKGRGGSEEDERAGDLNVGYRYMR